MGSFSLPTGASSADDVVPEGARVAARAPVAGARVMLLSQADRLQLLVAYKGDAGWHGVEVAPAPPRSAAAWAATRGGAGVPALSAVYGRTDGARVQVAWADGKTAEAVAGSGGVYLVARAGHVRSESVTVLAPDGSVLSKVEGP